MSELLKLILTGAISSSGTIIVCLINNAVTLKRDRMSRDENAKKELTELEKKVSKQISDINTDISNQINGIKSDFMAHLKEIISTQQEITTKIGMLEYKYEEQTKNIEKTQHELEKIREFENRLSVLEEKMRVANARIADLEK